MKMHVKKLCVEKYFLFFHTNTPRKFFFLTFLGWKMKKLFSTLIKLLYVKNNLLVINFLDITCPRVARWPIKESKDVDFALYSKRKKGKIAILPFFSGPDYVI